MIPILNGVQFCYMSDLYRNLGIFKDGVIVKFLYKVGIINLLHFSLTI